MSFITKIRQLASRYVPVSIKDADAVHGYDLWSESYDAQPDNLMLKLDEQLFTIYIGNIQLEGKSVADIGCGTGRHWAQLFAKKPGQLTGYDVSPGMLKKLKEKYPAARVFEIKNNHLTGLEDGTCDVVLSTLTMAHISDAKMALQEWSRILKKGGDMIITDYHPGLLSKGGDRSFKYKGKYVSIKNNVYNIEHLKKLFIENNLNIRRFNELFIDNTLKHHYEQQGKLNVYEKNEGLPLIYAFHLKKE